MRRRIALLVLLAAAFATTACAPATSTPTPTASAAPTSTAGPTTPAAEAYGLIVSVSAVTVTDTDGAPIADAPWSDGDAVLDLLSESIGTTPTGERNAQFATTTYDWGGLSLLVSDGGAASIAISATEAGPLQLRADGGLAVGSPRIAAEAQGATADPTAPDLLRFEVTEAPGTTSLATGQTGADFVALVLEGDEIVRILAPSNDYGDV